MVSLLVPSSSPISLEIYRNLSIFGVPKRLYFLVLIGEIFAAVKLAILCTGNSDIRISEEVG